MVQCPVCGQEIQAEDKIPYAAIIDDLNAALKFKERGKPGFKNNSKATKKLIRGRYDDGHKLEDFLAVHKNMADRWLGDPRMERFLRPSTLYRAANFESYLNHEGPGGQGANLEAERAVQEIISAIKDGRLRVSPFEGFMSRVVYDAGGFIPLRRFMEPNGPISPEEYADRVNQTTKKLTDSYLKLKGGKHGA